jgi:pimeloyl-ACP methyl ester carboxylesterase
MVEVQHAVLGGVGLAYELHGASDAPPLVLLHALGEGRSDWAPVVGRFAERFRVVAVDLRGHGDSDWPGTYSFQFMADDVLRLLDHLGLSHVTLLGHSMGGCVAYLIAEQSPGRVEFLIVEDAPPPFVRERPLPERPEGELDFDWAVVPAIVGEVSRGNPTMWDRLSSITAPTLLVGGGPDSHIPQEKLQEVADRISDCSLVTIPVGHLVHAARPTDFTDAALDWFTRTSLS